MKIAGLKMISYIEIKSGNRELTYCYGAPSFFTYCNGKEKIFKDISFERFMKAVNKYAPECKFNGGDFVKYDTKNL